MRQRNNDIERLKSFSDGVFAVLITILVLELKAPSVSAWEGLYLLWPTGLSYGVSYLFIAIVWINHHHLFSQAEVITTRLMWANFGHLFSVSLIPFSTAWIAGTDLAPIPVSFYALVFVFVNLTYLVLRVEGIDRQAKNISTADKRRMRMRSLTTLALFCLASVIALYYPVGGLGVIFCCLVLYLRP